MSLGEKLLTIILVVILLITMAIIDYRGRIVQKELDAVKPTIDSITRKLNSVTKSYDSLVIKYDSIAEENYGCEFLLNRYEIAYQIFLNRNPKAANQYGTIISDETE